MDEDNFLPKLSQNLLKILDNDDDEYYDITIEVGNDPYVKVFRAHMVILNYRSDYLRRILSTNKKKNDETLVHIKLPNISPEIFQIILRYIYGGKLSLKECDTSDIIKILISANELNLQELVSYLQLYIIKNNENWMEENFNLVYQTSFENNSFLELQNYCVDLISKGPDKILKSMNFSSIPEKLLISIVQNNNFQMSEIQVWKYVIKWGLAQNPELPTDPAIFSKEDFNVLKNTLQQLIPFIKFSNISSREFSEEVLPYKKILPKEFYKDLLKKFLNLHPDSKPSDDLKSIDHPDGKLTDNLKSIDHPDSKLTDNLKSIDHPDSKPSDDLKSIDHPDGKLTDNLKSIDHPDSKLTDNLKSIDHPDSKLTDNLKSIDHSDSKLTDNLKNIDSKIITVQHAELISKWIDKLDVTDKPNSLYEFKLIFRGSRDGFASNEFHKICDDRSCTVTIIKVKGNNQILGGYNPIEWKFESDYGVTKDSFIFSFEDGDDINDHILSRVVKKDYAIFNDHTYGPSFGGADLILRGDIGHYMKDSYEKQIRGPPSEPVLHYGVGCDCCNHTIRGKRWNCTTCVIYDLCQDCKPQSHKHRHPNDHRLMLMPHSDTSKYAPRISVHDTKCNYCNKTIREMRWKCELCPNFNMCQDCKFYSKKFFHPHNISYFKLIGRDSRNAICDYCKLACTGNICYKCANNTFYIKEYELFQVVKR
ncbi:uncharacterized protein OCT59_020955 [Rhizophagus irregularis]|uniref:uncharacterized protein n=1 Tax=Rhizophagus irregularis TaxID=588596 RepID=UPI000CB999CC|nr:hypothetical protein OCT59_020955 [Rhizophagus irregularis]